MRPPELLLLRELDDLDTDGDGEEDRLLEALDGEGLEDRLLRVGATERVRLEVELETRLREGIGRDAVGPARLECGRSSDWNPVHRPDER